jgi:hypothetical protein
MSAYVSLPLAFSAGVAGAKVLHEPRLQVPATTLYSGTIKALLRLY